MPTAACRFYFTAILLLLPIFTFAQPGNTTPSVSDLTIYISNQWAEEPPVADSTVLIMPACGDEKLYDGFYEVNLFLESVLETLGPRTLNFVPYELTARQLSFMSAAADEDRINHEIESQWERFSGADTILRLRVNRSDKETSFVLEQTGTIDANHLITAADRAPTVGDLMRTALSAYNAESHLFDEERCAEYPALEQFIEKPKPFFISQGFHLMTNDKSEDSQKLASRLAGMGLWHSTIRRTGDTRTVVALLDQRDLTKAPYARAHMSLIRKNSADAFDAWADYLNSNPNHYRALHEFAQAETFEGHCSEMYLANLQTILDLSPSSPLRDALYGQATVRAAWEYRGDSYGDVVNKDHWKYFHALSALGAQRLESARQRDGLVPLVASELLAVYASEGRMELALELLSEYDEQFPEDISPWIALMHFLRPRWSGSPFVGPQFLEQALEKKAGYAKFGILPYVYYAEEAQIAQPRSDLPTALGAYMMQNQHSLGQILRGLEMLASSQEDAAVAASVDILLSLGRKERAMAIYREHPMIYRQAMSQLPSGDSINLLKQGQYVLSEGGYWTELVELVDMASKAEELYRIRNPYLQSIVSTSAKQYYKEMAAIMNDGAQPGGDFVSLARRSGHAHEPMLAVLVLHLKSDDLHRATNEYAVERAKFVKTYWNEPEMQELLIYVDAAVAQRNGDGETARRRLITVNCARPIRIDWVRREVCAYISAANSAKMNEMNAAGTPETSPQ